MEFKTKYLCKYVAVTAVPIFLLMTVSAAPAFAWDGGYGPNGYGPQYGGNYGGSGGFIGAIENVLGLNNIGSNYGGGYGYGGNWGLGGIGCCSGFHHFWGWHHFNWDPYSPCGFSCGSPCGFYGGCSSSCGPCGGGSCGGPCGGGPNWGGSPSYNQQDQGTEQNSVIENSPGATVNQYSSQGQSGGGFGP